MLQSSTLLVDRQMLQSVIKWVVVLMGAPSDLQVEEVVLFFAKQLAIEKKRIPLFSFCFSIVINFNLFEKQINIFKHFAIAAQRKC